jgi:hypothetical protein
MAFSYHDSETEVDEDLLYGSRDGEPMPKPTVTAKKPVQTVSLDSLREEMKAVARGDRPAPADAGVISYGYGARRTDPETSHEAVPDLSTSAGVREVIQQAAALHGAGTEEEFSEWTGIPRPSISPQFRPMIRAGLLVDVIGQDGKKLKRKNKSGKSALVRGLPSAKATAPRLEDLDDLY